MKTTITQTLQALKKQFGESIFNEPKRFKATLADNLPGDEMVKIRNLLNIAICDMKAYSKLESDLANNKPFAVNIRVDEMVEKWWPERATAQIAIECIMELLDPRYREKELLDELEVVKQSERKLSNELEAVKQSEKELSDELETVKQSERKLSNELDMVKQSESKLSNELDAIKQNEKKLYNELDMVKRNEKKLYSGLDAVKQNERKLSNEINYTREWQNIVAIILHIYILAVYLYILWGTDIVRTLWTAESFNIAQYLLPLAFYLALGVTICSFYEEIGDFVFKTVFFLYGFIMPMIHIAAMFKWGIIAKFEVESFWEISIAFSPWFIAVSLLVGGFIRYMVEEKYERKLL